MLMMKKLIRTTRAHNNTSLKQMILMNSNSFHAMSKHLSTAKHSQLLLPYSYRSIVSKFFVKPMFEERQEKRSSSTDSKEIFAQISRDQHILTYQQALEMLSDLAYIVVPFDKTTTEFQQLLARLKILLQNQSGNVKMHELIDATTRLGVDTLNNVIRQKVQEGNYSRSPADICACLYFFAVQFKITQSQRDVDLFEAVLHDLTHMEVQNLKIENLDLLVRAFAHSADSSFQEKIKNLKVYSTSIDQFMPKLIEQSANELLRCNLNDIITLMESAFKLWNCSVIDSKEYLIKLFFNCDMYLSEYLGQSKKDITGSQFATLVHMIAQAHFLGLHSFNQKVIHRLQHIFLNDNAELYVFSMSDIQKLLVGFETINDYFNRNKVLEGLVELILSGQIYEDEAFLEVLNECNKKGLIVKYQELAVKARVYFQDRFDFMDRKTILGFLELFNSLGMLFEDKELAIVMKEHIGKSYHAYELPELFQAYKLLSLNFYRDSETFCMIEDAVKIRAADESQRQSVSADNLKDLINGLKLHVQYNKRLDASLRTLIKGSYLLDCNKELFVTYIGYAADFETKVDDALRQKLANALEVHKNNLSPQEKIFLKLCGQGLLPQTTLESLEIEASETQDYEHSKGLALLGVAQLNEQEAMKGLKSIDDEYNLMEVIEKILKERGIEYEGHQLVCDGRLRAAFVLKESRTIIDVVDHQLAYYQKDAYSSKQLRLYGRIADKVAKENGFPGGYRQISLVEMDFAQDEQAFIDEALGIAQQQSKVKVLSKS